MSALEEADALIARGDVLQDSGDCKAAAALFRKASIRNVSRNATRAPLSFYLGIWFYRFLALIITSPGVRIPPHQAGILAPDDAEPWTSLGVCLMLQQRTFLMGGLLQIIEEEDEATTSRDTATSEIVAGAGGRDHGGGGGGGGGGDGDTRVVGEVAVATVERNCPGGLEAAAVASFDLAIAADDEDADLVLYRRHALWKQRRSEGIDTAGGTTAMVMPARTMVDAKLMLESSWSLADWVSAERCVLNATYIHRLAVWWHCLPSYADIPPSHGRR